MIGELVQRFEGRPGSQAKEGVSIMVRETGTSEIRARLTQLTQREQQVMQLIVVGSTSREMAEQLGISIRTIEVHRAHLMLKMGTKRVPELVRWVLTLGV